MSWRSWSFGKAPPAPDAPHALLADIAKRGKQYLDEVDNGKWVYPQMFPAVTVSSLVK